MGGMPGPRSLPGGWIVMSRWVGISREVDMSKGGVGTHPLCLVLTSCSEHRNGLYASYWNAFLFSFIITAPRIYLNGEELKNDTLIDNDADTCVSVPGYNGCSVDKVTIQDIFHPPTKLREGNVCTGVCLSFCWGG